MRYLIVACSREKYTTDGACKEGHSIVSLGKLLKPDKAIAHCERKLGRHSSLLAHMPGNLSPELESHDDVLAMAQTGPGVTAEMSQARLRAQ